MGKSGSKPHRKQPQDDVNAIDRLALLRYFASGQIAGGAGVTLTLLLTAINVHTQSYIALGVLNALLLSGCFYFLYSALRWMGFPIPWGLIVPSAIFLVYQVWSGVIVHPEHLVKAFSDDWWALVGRAVFATIIGAGFRFVVEMEMDDLQYGLDHGLGVKQLRPGYEQTKARGTESEGRAPNARGIGGLIGLVLVLVVLRQIREKLSPKPEDRSTSVR
jgi:hypothetical protein